MDGIRSELATKLLNSSDAKVAAAAKRIFFESDSDEQPYYTKSNTRGNINSDTNSDTNTTAYANNTYHQQVHQHYHQQVQEPLPVLSSSSSVRVPPATTSSLLVHKFGTATRNTNNNTDNNNNNSSTNAISADIQQAASTVAMIMMAPSSNNSTNVNANTITTSTSTSTSISGSTSSSSQPQSTLASNANTILKTNLNSTEQEQHLQQVQHQQLKVQVQHQHQADQVPSNSTDTISKQPMSMSISMPISMPISISTLTSTSMPNSVPVPVSMATPVSASLPVSAPASTTVPVSAPKQVPTTVPAPAPVTVTHTLPLERKRVSTTDERLQRSRERNKMHARKTRQRKKEHMNQLESRVQGLKQRQLNLKLLIKEKNTASILLGMLSRTVTSSAGGNDAISVNGNNVNVGNVTSCSSYTGRGNDNANTASGNIDNSNAIAKNGTRTDTDADQSNTNTMENNVTAVSNNNNNKNNTNACMDKVDGLLKRKAEEIPDSSKIPDLPALILPGHHNKRRKTEAGDDGGSNAKQEYPNDGIDYELLGKDRTSCTPEELDRIRKERNRMHAKRTRDRKRIFMEEMEKIISQLEAENDILEQHLADITTSTSTGTDSGSDYVATTTSFPHATSTSYTAATNTTMSGQVTPSLSSPAQEPCTPHPDNKPPTEMLGNGSINMKINMTGNANVPISTTMNMNIGSTAANVGTYISTGTRFGIENPINEAVGVSGVGFASQVAHSQSTVTHHAQVQEQAVSPSSAVSTVSVSPRPNHHTRDRSLSDSLQPLTRSRQCLSSHHKLPSSITTTRTSSGTPIDC